MALARKGVVLAGGTGSRLGPLTRAFSKHLLPVFDQPMIYAPIALLMQCGVREVLLVCAPRDLPLYRELLGDGTAWGISIEYVEQRRPLGLLDAFTQSRDFLAGSPSILALGDNVFCAEDWADALQKCCAQQSGASVFAVPTDDPSAYGIVTLNADGSVREIAEKPALLGRALAIPGFYFYDDSAMERAAACMLESGQGAGVSELHNSYLADSLLQVERVPESVTWFDAGRADLLLAASRAFSEFTARTGRHACSPDEIAWRSGWITQQRLAESADLYSGSEYGRFLHSLL